LSKLSADLLYFCNCAFNLLCCHVREYILLFTKKTFLCLPRKLTSTGYINWMGIHGPLK